MSEEGAKKGKLGGVAKHWQSHPALAFHGHRSERLTRDVICLENGNVWIRIRCCVYDTSFPRRIQPPASQALDILSALHSDLRQLREFDGPRWKAPSQESSRDTVRLEVLCQYPEIPNTEN